MFQLKKNRETLNRFLFFEFSTLFCIARSVNNSKNTKFLVYLRHPWISFNERNITHAFNTAVSIVHEIKKYRKQITTDIIKK